MREITKVHEEVLRTTTAYAAEHYADGSIKGEIVLVLEGKKQDEQEDSYTMEQAVTLAQELIADGVRITDAAKQAAAITGYKKNEIYKELTT